MEESESLRGVRESFGREAISCFEKDLRDLCDLRTRLGVL